MTFSWFSYGVIYEHLSYMACYMILVGCNGNTGNYFGRVVLSVALTLLIPPVVESICHEATFIQQQNRYCQLLT